MHSSVDFQDACERRDYALLQDSISTMSKKEAIAHLHGLFPHKAKAWFTRNLPHIVQLDPRGLSRLLGHSDPTADKAIRNVMKELIPA